MKIETTKTIKKYKELKQKDLPLYTKKFDGEWLYRLRLHHGRLVADKLVVSPYKELKETVIDNVLGEGSEPSNQDEWRLNMHKLITYFRENE